VVRGGDGRAEDLPPPRAQQGTPSKPAQDAIDQTNDRQLEKGVQKQLTARTELASSLKAGDAMLSWVCETLTIISSSWPPEGSPLYSVPLRWQPLWSKMVICTERVLERVRQSAGIRREGKEWG